MDELKKVHACICATFVPSICSMPWVYKSHERDLQIRDLQRINYVPKEEGYGFLWKILKVHQRSVDLRI